MEKIKVIIVDDHTMFRDGLKASFNSSENIIVIDEAADGWELLRKLKDAEPDVVIMDINMPGMDGIETAKLVKGVYPEIKILLLTMYDSQQYLLDAFKQGVYGYILKMANIEKLFYAVEQIAKGEIYYDPDIVKSLPPVNPDEAEKEADDYLKSKFHLTKREVEVARLIACGYRSNEIADKLNISQNTVYNHRYNIFEKLNVHTTADLVRILVENNSFSE